MATAAVAAVIGLFVGGAVVAPTAAAETTPAAETATTSGTSPTSETAPRASAPSAPGAATSSAPGPVQKTLIPASELANPGDVAVDATGAVYVADVDNSRVLKVPKGGVPEVVGFTGLAYPSSVAVDRAGTVYVVDQQGIKELLADGTQIQRTGHIDYPGGLAVDSASTLYVSMMEAGRVYGFRTDGTSWQLGFTGLLTPRGIAVDGADNVSVADQSKDFVVKLPKGGGWGSQTQLPISVHEPTGLALDHGDDVFVADAANSRVVVLPKGGGQSTVGFTGLSYPVGVAADGDGNVFVSDPAVGLVELSSAPVAPGAIVASPGNGQAQVSWTAPTWTGGTPLTGYVVTPSVGGVAQTPTMFFSSATTQTLPGLANGVSYSFTVAAVTGLGVGSRSAPSNAVIVGAPGNPAFVNAVSGDGQASLGWFEPLANSDPISSYVVTPYVGSVAQPPQTFAPTAPRVVTGLTNGTTYTFQVTALNARGAGAPSAPSPPVVIGTPGMPGFAHAVIGNGQATVSWWPPPGNGAPITSYVVTPFSAGVPGPAQLFPTPANVVTVAGLTPGVSYTFQIEAVNRFGRGRPGSTATPPVATALPHAPGFLRATPGRGAATVSWWPVGGDSAPLTGSTVTPYVDGVAQTPRTISSGANSQTVTGLTNGTSYSFRVELSNAVGRGPAGTTAPVMVGIPPNAPISPSVQAGDGSATVSWTAPSDNGLPITAYIVTPWAGASGSPHRFDSTATTQTISGLTNGADTFFVVQAVSAAGAGPGMVTPSGKIGLVPGPAYFPTARAGDASATVSWWAANGNGSPVLGYIVVPYVGAVAQTARTFHSTATTQVIDGLTNGTTYTFRVAAFNVVGTGPYGSTFAVTPAAVPSAPAAPSVQAGRGSVDVTWAAPNDNGSSITGYVVTVYAGAVVAATQVVPAPATTLTVSGLSDGTSYTARVAATNAVGSGPQSPASPPIVAGSPSAPGRPSATAGSGTATLSWTAADAHGYTIVAYVVTPYIGATAQPTTTFPSPATSETVTGLTNGSTYTFTVRALSNCGGACATGAASPASNAVTPPGVLPTAPGSPTAVPGGGQATVSWTAADGHGAPITGYVVTPFIGAAAQTARVFASSATTQTITGLANGTTYTFAIAATTAVGTGPTASTSPIIVGRPAAGISAGEWFSCSLLTDQTVQCWGANNSGQLADGTTTDRPVPAAVTGLTGVTALSSGWAHECALLSTQTLSCWGWNPYGQLGNGTINNVNVHPVPVPGLTGVTAVATGFGHTCALLGNGTVACWGWNGSGQLGDGTTVDKSTPVVVPGLTGVTAITAGASHTCALLATGSERCWGRNAYGQLGDGTTTNRSSPVPVLGLTGVTGITAGWEHSCATLATGGASCWGANAAGALGDGTTIDRHTPVAVQGLTDVVGIAAGNHTCARSSSGAVACWGGNAYGEVGDGTTITRLVPVTVAGLNGVTKIAVGLHTSCALVSTGNELCWGRNNKGQVGDGTTTNRKVPVVVHGF